MSKQRDHIQKKSISRHQNNKHEQQETSEQTKGIYAKEIHIQTQEQQKDKSRLTFACHRRGDAQIAFK